MRIVSAGSEQNLSFRLPQPPVMSNVVPIRVAMGGGLEVGETVRLPVFDPTSLSTRTVEVDVLEHDTLFVTDSAAINDAGRWESARTDSVPAWKIAEEFGGVRVESWVDEDGRILQRSSALGFSMQKTEYELVAAGAGGLASRLRISDRRRRDPVDGGAEQRRLRRCRAASTNSGSG